MTGALTLLLIICLLQGSQCQTFSVSLLQNVEVLEGSCVTVPCSFQVKSEYEQKLSDQCEAKWLQMSNNIPQLTETNPVTGNLTKKNCTTTFSNVQLKHKNKYYFRLECPVGPKYAFKDSSVNIKVRTAPPSPTLTPPTLKVKEGDSVSLKCSAPAPCLPHPPTLTWTPRLGHSQENLQKNQDKSHILTSVLNFTASDLHHRQKISCTAVYKKQDGSPDVAVTASLTAKVSFPPQILSSSDCTITEDQVSCSCETTGNPPPTLYWHLDGKPVNQSKLIVISEFLNVPNPRSIITVNQAEERDLSSLLCLSLSSAGSASKQFYDNFLHISVSDEEFPMMPVFITTVCALVLLVCVLLFVIRCLKTKSLTNENITAELNQHTTELKEEPNTVEESFYSNLEELTEKHRTKPAAELSCRNADRTEGPRKSSRKKCGEDAVYAAVDVIKTAKRKKRESNLNTTQTGSSYLEEEKCFSGASDRRFVDNMLEMETLYAECKPKNVKKETECEYAQVKFKSRSVMLE